MATRSLIGRETADGIRYIYCHWDGYPSNQGPLLLGGYATPDKVEALLDLGDLSSLGMELGEQHPFDSQAHRDGGRSWCKAYGRDRHECDAGAKTARDRDDFAGRCARYRYGEWVYLFTDAGWLVLEGGADASGFRPLAEEVTT